jgi:hypothetical protein
VWHTAPSSISSDLHLPLRKSSLLFSADASQAGNVDTSRSCASVEPRYFLYSSRSGHNVIHDDDMWVNQARIVQRKGMLQIAAAFGGSQPPLGVRIANPQAMLTRDSQIATRRQSSGNQRTLVESACAQSASVKRHWNQDRGVLSVAPDIGQAGGQQQCERTPCRKISLEFEASDEFSHRKHILEGSQAAVEAWRRKEAGFAVVSPGPLRRQFQRTSPTWSQGAWQQSVAFTAKAMHILRAGAT